MKGERGRRQAERMQLELMHASGSTLELLQHAGGALPLPRSVLSVFLSAITARVRVVPDQQAARRPRPVAQGY